MGEIFKKEWLEDMTIDYSGEEVMQKLVKDNIKPRLLFLDDRSKRLHAALKKYGDDYDVTLVCTAKECIKMLSNEGPWDVVSLDHDLCFEEFVDPARADSGMQVVRWLCGKYNIGYLAGLTVKIPTIIIHTSNKSAAYQMELYLDKAKYYEVKVERFSYDD